MVITRGPITAISISNLLTPAELNTSSFCSVRAEVTPEPVWISLGGKCVCELWELRWWICVRLD